VWLRTSDGKGRKVSYFETKQLKYTSVFTTRILHFGNSIHFFGSTQASPVCLSRMRDGKLKTNTDYAYLKNDTGRVKASSIKRVLLK
jgi:hypothetical protein